MMEHIEDPDLNDPVPEPLAPSTATQSKPAGPDPEQVQAVGSVTLLSLIDVIQAVRQAEGSRGG